MKFDLSKGFTEVKNRKVVELIFHIAIACLTLFLAIKYLPPHLSMFVYVMCVLNIVEDVAKLWTP